MTLTKRHIEISEAIAICTRAGITITSHQVGKRFSVKVDDNGKTKVFKKEVYAHQINSAIKKTWRWYAANILNKSNGEES